GLPSGYLNVVTGGGSTVGNAIVEHPGIALISFTGSGKVGWEIKEKAGRKKVGLELGNNAPIILEPDGDWDRAARQISVAGFSHAGQSCISVQRIFVHEQIADRFTDTLAKLVGDLVVGDPMDDSTDVSALIRPASSRRISTTPSPPHAASSSAPCSSTRCPRGGPTRCPTAGSRRAATPRRALPTRCGR